MTQNSIRDTMTKMAARGQKTKQKIKTILYGFHYPFVDSLLLFLSLFLDASSHLYMRVCPSVRPSVCPYVRPSVCPSVNIKEKPPKTTISACETHRITRPGLFHTPPMPNKFLRLFISHIMEKIADSSS